MAHPDYPNDIWNAARRGDYRQVVHLVEQVGVDKDSIDEFGNNALYYASLCGHTNLCRYLIRKSTNSTDRCYFNALNQETQRLFHNPFKTDHPTKPKPKPKAQPSIHRHRTQPIPQYVRWLLRPQHPQHNAVRQKSSRLPVLAKDEMAKFGEVASKYVERVAFERDQDEVINKEIDIQPLIALQNLATLFPNVDATDLHRLLRFNNFDVELTANHIAASITEASPSSSSSDAVPTLQDESAWPSLHDAAAAPKRSQATKKAVKAPWQELSESTLNWLAREQEWQVVPNDDYDMLDVGEGSSVAAESLSVLSLAESHFSLPDTDNFSQVSEPFEPDDFDISFEEEEEEAPVDLAEPASEETETTDQAVAEGDVEQSTQLSVSPPVAATYGPWLIKEDTKPRQGALLFSEVLKSQANAGSTVPSSPSTLTRKQSSTAFKPAAVVPSASHIDDDDDVDCNMDDMYYCYKGARTAIGKGNKSRHQSHHAEYKDYRPPRTTTRKRLY